MPVQLPMGFMLPETDWVAPKELPDLRGRGLLAIDTEVSDNGLANKMGPGWPYKGGYVAGVSIAAPGAPPVYVPVAHPDTDNFSHEAVGKWLADHINSGDQIVMQNAHFDLGWIGTEWGIHPTERINDTIAAAVCLDETRLTYNLDDLCEWKQVPGKEKGVLEKALKAHGLGPHEMVKVPAKYIGAYAEQDAQSLLALHTRMRAELEAQSLLPAYQLEADLIPMIVAMRRRGIRVGASRAEQVQRKLFARRDEILAELSRKLATGQKLTISDLTSPVKLAVFFDLEQVPYPTTPKTKKGSFSNDWMEKVDHWLPRLVVAARNMHSMADKFIGRYIMDFSHKSRVHAEIHQYRSDTGGTRTSRMSYSNPPLQQMPAPEEEGNLETDAGLMVRDIFEPEEGEIWGALDYSQQEYRLIASYASLCKVAGAAEVVKAYRQNPNLNFHQMTADMAGIKKKAAKIVNFGLAYGKGVPSLAVDLGLSIEEAKELMNKINENAPFVSRLSEVCQSQVQQKGYIRLIDGARIRFNMWEPRWHDKTVGPMPLPAAKVAIRSPDHPWFRKKLQRAKTHKALNALIQGSAARQTKAAMRNIWRAGYLPLIQMHDELGFSLTRDDNPKVLQQMMAEAVPTEVPMLIDAEFGPTWGQAKKSWSDAWK